MTSIRSSLPSRLRQLLSGEGSLVPSVKLDSETVSSSILLQLLLFLCVCVSACDNCQGFVQLYILNGLDLILRCHMDGVVSFILELFFLVAVAFVYAFHQALGVLIWCYWRVFNHLGYFCAIKFQIQTRCYCNFYFFLLECSFYLLLLCDPPPLYIVQVVRNFVTFCF